jgi:hypothetical protein
MRTKLSTGLLLIILAITSCAFAQEVTGTISGIVKDASGAVIPNAKVTITNTDKNAVIRDMTTDSNGSYLAPLLPIGRYSITIEAAGFKSTARKDILLYASSKLSQDFQLVVGSAGETINVEAAAAQVQTQSAAAAGVITGTQVREIPLNGRNWEQLVTLMPGVSDAGNSDQIYVGAFAPQGTNLVTFSMNGGRREQNNFMVDGADNIDRGSNLTLLSFPSIDAISEFTVIRGQYDPEFGRAASGQVNVVTKSGTSKLHGNIYEFFRNDALNANDVITKRTQLAGNKPNKPPILRYNNFGGTIGGPIYIPKIYEQTNKTFFFFSEEQRKNIKYTPAHAAVPTADMLAGNFRVAVCTSFQVVAGVKSCLTTGQTISPASFDPIAKAYIQDIFSQYPQPNAAVATDPFGFDSTLRGIFNFREEIYKVDHIFSQKFSINGKILRDNIPTREPGGLFTGMLLDNIGSTETNSPGHGYNIRATIVPSSTFLIDVGWAYSYGAILSTPDNLLAKANSPNVASAVVLPFTQTTLGRVPSVSLTGGSGPLTFGPYDDFNQNHTYFGNVSKVWGTHSFKFGATYYRYRKNENAGNGNQGQYTFSNQGIPTCPAGQSPGVGASNCAFNFEQSWANFLTGNVGTFTQSFLDLTADIRAQSFEYYAQDSWRVRPNLTVSYGFRHSFFRQPTDANGFLMNFDPKFYDPAKAPCILSTGATDVTKSPAGVLSSACNPNFDPLNGYIYSKPPVGFESHKSPYGDKVSQDNNMAIAPRIGIAWDPWGDGKTSIRTGFGLFYDSGLIYGNAENNIFQGIGIQNALTFTNVTTADPTGGAPIPSTGIPGSASRLQSRIDPNYKVPYTQQWSLDIQRNIINGWILDVGYYGNNAIHLPGFIDLNQPAENSFRSCTPTTPCFAGPGSANAVDFGAVPVVNTGNTSKLNALRPFIGYSGMDAVRNIYTANYHSLQSQIQKQWANSTLFNLSYTWSHGLTTNQADRSTGGILPLQGHIRDNNYGPTIGDRRHVVTANFVWNLPWYKTQQGFVGHLLGGWEIAGVQTMQTGLPATVTSNQLIDPTGAGCLGPSPCAFRANQVGNPDSGGLESINTTWFNGAAFANPTAADTTIPSERPGAVRLPGFWRTDLALFKNIKFTESVMGQFRLETFNTFNHTNPICCGSFATTNANFNRVTTARDPRYLELGMKINF